MSRAANSSALRILLAALVTGSIVAPQTKAQGFVVEGCIAETPGHPCGLVLSSVRLEPLGLSAYHGTSGRFRFESVPPGDYALTVQNRCNPFGCWPKVPVSVGDSDVFVSIPILPFCPGDCDNDYRVSVDELVLGVRSLLSNRVFFSCKEFDRVRDARPTIDELVLAVQSALRGCSDVDRF